MEGKLRAEEGDELKDATMYRYVYQVCVEATSVQNERSPLVSRRTGEWSFSQGNQGSVLKGRESVEFSFSV